MHIFQVGNFLDKTVIVNIFCRAIDLHLNKLMMASAIMEIRLLI